MLTILIVDDDPDQRASLADALGDRYEVFMAEDAETAFDLISAQPGRFDLIITDLRMPGRTGIQLQRDLREQKLAVPVVLMSSDEHVSRLAAEEGFYDCLAKPLSYDLIEAITARVAAEKLRKVSADILPQLASEKATVANALPDDDPEH